MDSGTAKLGMMVARNAAQKKKDDHHDQRDGQHQLKLHVCHRRANRRSAVGENVDLHGGRQRGLQLRQKFFDAIDDRDNVGARLALNVQDDCGIFVRPRGLANVLRAIHHRSDIRQSYRAAVAIGDDDGLVAIAPKSVGR